MWINILIRMTSYDLGSLDITPISILNIETFHQALKSVSLQTQSGSSSKSSRAPVKPPTDWWRRSCCLWGGGGTDGGGVPRASLDSSFPDTWMFEPAPDMIWSCGHLNMFFFTQVKNRNRILEGILSKFYGVMFLNFQIFLNYFSKFSEIFFRTLGSFPLRK